MNTKELGDYGEGLACEYLVRNGYKILGRNYRVDFGEIDITAKKKWRLFGADKTIHFVEVKALSRIGSFFPEEHVNYEKKRKLRQMAEIWLQKNKFPLNWPYQIDIISVYNGDIEFFENVVQD